MVVHSLGHARAALKAARTVARPVLLVSPPAVAGAAGLGWFAAVIDQVIDQASEGGGEPPPALVDCGDRAGHALAALRHGFRRIRYDGPAFERISDIAAQLGAELTPTLPLALDMLSAERAGEDPELACRHWLETA